MKVWLRILAWCIWCTKGLAQELLPLGFWAQPQLLNPALTGVMDGQFRFSATHQFRPATGFADLSSTWAGVDFPFRLRELPAGGGSYVLIDRAAAWSTYKLGAGLAYEAPLGPRVRYDHLRAGISAAAVNRRVEPSDLYFEDQFDGRGFGRPTQEGFGNLSQWHADISIGAIYFRTQKIPGNTEVAPFLGFSVSRINRPAVGLLVRRSERLSVFWCVQGGARLFTRTPFQIAASLLYARANQSEWLGGSLLAEFVVYEGGYWFTRPLGSILAGAVLRARDQYALVAGFTLQKGLTVGLAYGLLTRRTITPTAFGGIQVMLQYQLGYNYRERGTVYPFPPF
ncbi:MAG: type IX secretion system membrane protein PorP/SprF [Bacteroidia bacterium]